MDPLTLMAITSGVGALGNVIANSIGSANAGAIQQELLEKWAALNIPDPAQQKLAVAQFMNTGQMTPAMQSAIAQNPSEFSKIVTSPVYSQAQDAALKQLQQMGHGGFNLSDQAQINQALQQSSTQAKGNQDAIIANQAQRGTSGSGFGAQAQLVNIQNQQNQDANNSLNIAAQAQQRALQAIQGAGQLGGQLQNQQFNQQAQAAQAQNAINQFNAANAQNVNANNINALNNAQMYNVQNAQDIANRNTGAQNNANSYNSQLAQQQFENQMNVLKGEQSIYNNQSNLAQNQAQGIGNAISGLAQSATNAIGVNDTNNKLGKLYGSFGSNNPNQYKILGNYNWSS
jgi:hypothetical protein